LHEAADDARGTDRHHEGEAQTGGPVLPCAGDELLDEEDVDRLVEAKPERQRGGSSGGRVLRSARVRRPDAPPASAAPPANRSDRPKNQCSSCKAHGDTNGSEPCLEQVRRQARRNDCK
jgi:hypothetical protein